MKIFKKITTIGLTMLMLVMTAGFNTAYAAGETSAAFADNFLCAVKNNGALWVYIKNSEGRLQGSNDAAKTTAVKIMDGVKSVSTVYNTIIALKSNGELWYLGVDYDGLSGDVKNSDKYINREKIMSKVSSVVQGNLDYQLVIKTNGELWGWERTLKPASMLFTDGKPEKIMDDVASVSVGKNHCMAIKTNGELWGWGDNTFGQIGNGKSSEIKFESDKINYFSLFFHENESFTNESIKNDTEMSVKFEIETIDKYERIEDYAKPPFIGITVKKQYKMSR